MAEATAADLMTGPVLRVGRDEAPGELAEGLLELDIKSVIITDDEDHPEGIITSTDYLRMAAAGVDPGETTVGEWMTEGIITLRADEPVRAAADLMASNGINHLPIVDDEGKAVGILSATDITAYVAGGD